MLVLVVLVRDTFEHSQGYSGLFSKCGKKTLDKKDFLVRSEKRISKKSCNIEGPG